MVVCCRPAASSIASLTARREAGEPSTGAKISSINPKDCGRPDAATEIRLQTYSSCPRKTRISRLGD